MKKINLKYFFLLILIFTFSNQQARINPEEFKNQDFIFNENDVLKNYEFSLIEAKVLTKEEITLYLKKQGIHLTYDNCCKNMNNFNAWNDMKDVSDYEEIYSNTIYNSGPSITYDFPVKKIENKGYTVYHKLWIINKENPPKTLNIYFNYVDNSISRELILTRTTSNKKDFLTIEIYCKTNTNTVTNPNNIYLNYVRVSINNGAQTAPIELKGEISSITFEYSGSGYSPAIALHWTYYKIVMAYSNFSLKGNSLCNKVTNPCVSGYYCIGGVCKKCHPSCFDCVNGGLSTDCYSRCSTHSSIMTPDKGRCTIGYVDLNQFEDFDIEDIVPPPRNNRLTISFWIYVNYFPQESVLAYITNSFNPTINFKFSFTNNNLKINCAGMDGDTINNNGLNTWIFVKCAISFDHEINKKDYLFFRYYGNDKAYHPFKKYNAYTSVNITNCGHDFKKYYEPDDFISLHFFNFSLLKHDEKACNVYMKELVLYREFLPEPYDNKYFNIEKLLTSTLDLPEVLFIIPFDELKKEGNKYKIKCYSYQGNIIENEIIISPKETGEKFTLYPPKLFKRLNLLDKNKKYSSTDLLKIDDIILGSNTLIGSYDNIPLSCIDEYFVNFNTVNETNPTSYNGQCLSNCPSGKSMISGLGDRKGFCNKDCSNNPNEKCLIQGSDLLNFKSQFECENNYYNMFYKCENPDLNEQKKYIFYYDPNYIPGNIVIDVRHYNLKSYIIDFWYYHSDCRKITSGYIFYTNQVQIKKIESSYNVYTTAHDIVNTTSIYQSQWNNIVIEVYYDPREKRNYKTRVYVQIDLNTGNAKEVDHSENPYPLDYIYFCNGRRSSCNNLEINWFCGYYRNLRLFNGNLAQRHITFRYDEYYSDQKYLLLSSIVLYYPLYGSYISNNILRQYLDKLDPLTTAVSTTNTWNFPQYNYCKREDVIFNENNCIKGFSKDSTKCYECNDNKFFLNRLKGGQEITCTDTTITTDPNKYFVLKLPMDYDFLIEPTIYSDPDEYKGTTVNFYIKLYGFKGTDKIDIIYFGDHLKLSYNSNFDNLYFGLNLVTYSGTSETIVSNYYDFRKHFGLWTFISVATFNKKYDSFFPAMVRFEINHKKMPIVGPLDNLYIDKISFSNQIYALVQKLKIYKTYIIGAHSFETHLSVNTVNIDINVDLVKPTTGVEAYFEPVKRENECTFSKFGIISTITNYDCVPDYDDELLKSGINLKQYHSYINEARIGVAKDCNSKCDICYEGSEYDCSCNFKNSEEKLFLGNVSNHYCEKFKFINFAKAKTIEKSVKPAGEKFTLHFWVFAHSYVENVFKGLEVEWKNHGTIKVYLDSTNKYYFSCLIGNTPLDKIIDFSMNKWNFLHCAMNYEEKKAFINTEEDSFKLNFTFAPPATLNDNPTKLIIRDLTNDSTNIKDWGILFYKYIRLWKDCFQYSSFLSRIEIKKNYFDSYLLYQFHTLFNKDHKVYDTNPNDENSFIVTYNSSKIGTNIVSEEIYQDVNSFPERPILCNETGEYYDRKTEECVKFLDISNIENDIEIEKIDVAYSHNYGIAFWILLEDHKDITEPINFDWQFHMKISLQYDNTNSRFKAYCFPQNYFPYSVIIANKDLTLEQKSSQLLNFVKKEYKESLGGVWTWIQCSLSYNNRYFYLNEEGATLNTEVLYDDGTIKSENDEPLGYFFNNINENYSKLKIEITSNRDHSKHKKIYLRCFYLFKDYLPYNYNFKYMDMYRIDKEQFPPLTFALNFAEFKENENNAKEIEFRYRKYSSLENLITPDTFIVNIKNINSKELSANFIFLPLCNPLNNEKFNSDKQLCKEIEDCDKIALNCLYCMEENTPLVCKTHYYINIDSEKNKVECLNYCKGNYYRSPGTFPTQGICGTDCLSFDILRTCPNTGSSILTYQNDFECLTGYSRIGYQCFNLVEEPNKGALFYSGINYPYNIYQSFTNDFISLISKGYVLEFWFMIDHVIYNSTNFVNGNKYYYFYSKPHEVYLQNSKYFYSFSSDGFTYEITDFIHKYEWNKILIFSDATISGNKEVRVYVNFDKKKGKKHKVISGELTLTFIAFCSKDPSATSTLIYPECVSRGKPINWASAYYNNIRIWNIETSTIDTIQSFVNKIYLEYPQSILLFYPLQIQYLDNNVMQNIMGNLQEHIAFKCENGKRCTLYNKDNIIIYNYSSKFDWGLLHPNKFVNLMNGDFTLNINPGTCDDNCIRCYEETNIKNCYECKEGYILQYKECRNAEEFYFLKTPSDTAGAYINLAITNNEGKDFTDLISFTIVFWIKFYGILYPTVTEYCRILSLDSNTYLAFQRSTNDLVLLENSKIVFRDTNFKNYFGIWIPISIANYISNAQSEIYPNMFTLSVNRIDIPFTEGYSLPSTGIKVTQLQLGYEIIALFAELSIYSKFIQGAYGRIKASEAENDYLKDRFYYKRLIGNSKTNCVDVSNDLISSVSIICAPDYNVNFMNDAFCEDNTKYYLAYDNNNDEIEDADKCKECDELCNTLCFDTGEEKCSCDMTEGIFWLRRNIKMETYCEHIPYLDFSNIKPYTYINAPISKTKEYTIEFWFFVYSYNTEIMNFKTLWIEWNYHNRLKLYNEQNSLKVDCQPIWRSDDFDIVTYPDNKQGTLKYYQWNYVKCGTDLKNKKYFLNTITEYALKAKEEYFFDLAKIDSTASEDSKYFSIYRSNDFFPNFGYVFIRELKLWQQYNLDFLDLKYINFELTAGYSVDDLKRDFPGLILYYKNEFDLTPERNPRITEILSGKQDIIGRDPDYVGYNIVDPQNKGYAPLLDICPYGEVYNALKTQKCCPINTEYNEVTKECEPIENAEEDALCLVFSNLQKQCLTCKEDNVYLNKWINEFEDKCYYDCPPTLFEDPKMNQCRRCHETCYECDEDEYNNCISCTGDLYFNFKENTCIPNCQTADLTRSLSKPNLCVIFDADASLVNVDTLTPIDVNNFDYIEAIVIQPTSPEYKTLWLFDANQTNFINRELGFTDDIPLTSSPYTGDLTQLRAELDHNFFKTKHKYVFGLKIYVENEGLEVPIYVWWTLTMNAPPFGGEVTVMPYLGLYNTTTFIIRCVDFLDENTFEDELEYDFYYIEVNTNSKIKLTQDFSLNNEVYSNFTVRYYQLEYSNITIYCQVRDKFGAITEASNVITIVNQKNSPLYVLKQLVASFHIVDDALTDIQLLARAEVLMSLGINPYTERVPSSYFTTYEGSLTGEKVEIKDPQCITGYCNDNGDCDVIDVALTCKCVASFIGKECFLDKDGYTDLAYYYKKLYQRLLDRLILGNIAGEPINEIVFTAFYRLFFAAQNFFQEDSFFETNLIEFKNYLKQEVSYITQNEDRINKILDLDDFFFNYFYIKETQLKLTNRMNENYPFRNKTLTVSEYSSYKTAFQTLFETIDDDTSFIIKKYGKDYDYTCQHFIYHLKKIDQTFNDERYFESLKTVYVTYKPIIRFMNCLREKNPTFQYFFNYIEYLENPLSYDATYYPNVTAPLISIKIYDINGNPIPIRNCPSSAPIKISLPFNSYDWMNYINEQKWLFLPENYKLEDDPIFRDPILIWENGTISSDTVEQRIEKYYRYYNIVGLVHTPTSISLYEYTSFLFKNISDTFLLMFETNHLSSFSAMIIPNIMNFVVDGRFYYLPRYKVLFCFENHINNPAFYIWASLLFLFICISIFFYFYDYNYFDQLEELQFLQKEIIKVHFPYNQLEPGLNDENIFNLIPKESKLKKVRKKAIKNMFKGLDMDDIKENENENEEEENENGDSFFSDDEKKSKIKNTITEKNNYNEKPSTRRGLVSRNETKSNEGKNEEEKEKATEIRTYKKKNNSKRIKNKIENENENDNPPKRKNNYEEEDHKNAKQEQLNIKKKSKKINEDTSFSLKDINKEFQKQSKLKKNIFDKNNKNYEDEKDEDEDEKDENEKDYDENIIENFLKSEKNTIKSYSKGSKQNFNLQAIDSKMGFNSSKYTKDSKKSKHSKQSYFVDKDKIKANFVSLKRFHNRAGRINVDNDGIPLDIINEEEERKKALENFTRLSLTPYEFWSYNLKVRHVLVAPFINLTLFNNRWKKLMVLLTELYIEQLILSLYLTYKETIIISNILGLIEASLIAVIISNIIVYCFVFLFGTSTYQRKRLFRLVMMGERLIVDKAWQRLKRTMNFSFCFGFVIAMVFWFANLYITLIFTAVWSVQRSAWIVSFILCLFFDLVVGELLIEGICAFFFSKRVDSNFCKQLGESLNRLRAYRTLWP